MENADLIVAIAIASTPGLLSLGAGWWRIGRLEKDMERLAYAVEKRDEKIAHVDKLADEVKRCSDKLDAMEERIRDFWSNKWPRVEAAIMRLDEISARDRDRSGPWSNIPNTR